MFLGHNIPVNPTFPTKAAAKDFAWWFEALIGGPTQIRYRIGGWVVERWTGTEWVIA